MRYLYDLLVYLLRPVALAVVLWRGLRNRRYWDGLHERFGFGAFQVADTIWLHAVSLGEVSAAAPLIRACAARYPGMPLVLTTATPTGRARAHALFGSSVDVRIMPYDTPGSMRRLIDRARPALALVMETELWPNLFDQCRRRRIPIVLANARLSARSVTWYRRFGSLFRPLFSEGTLVAAQSVGDAERFIAIGAPRERIRVVGNVKFDVAIDAAAVDRGRRLRDSQWGDRPVWIAGSTHAGEEEPVLTAHAQVLMEAPLALLLLVPRHPERFEPAAELLRRRGVRFERRSTGRAVGPETQVLLVDTVGELATLYAAADAAFVGGSLVPVGGHNLLEAAALGIPVITGPFQANGLDIARLLIEEGAAFEVSGSAELGALLQRLLANPDERRRIGAIGHRVVDANRGSVGRLMEAIGAIL